MNPANPSPSDEEFSRLLAACDDALAAGRPAPTPAQLAAPPELTPRLVRARACLLWLERARVRDAAALASGDTPHPWASTTEVQPPPVQALGRFQVRYELGRGGGGIVFLAYDPLLRREVALKVPRPEAVLTPELRRRFLREARAAAGLEHPNLVTVHEVGEEGPLCYLVSAYCRGPSLSAWLKQQREPVPPRQAAGLVATLADAVHFMHGRGIIHRDIKPGNILLQVTSDEWRAMSKDGKPPDALVTCHLSLVTPKLTDFGLARPAEPDDVNTRTGTVLGTPAYMAPEQAERGDGIGPTADVYALGVLLYEVLTRRPPFKADTSIELLRQVVYEEPVPPGRLCPGLPRDVESVCLKCLEKQPERRYASAAALADDLRRFLDGQATRARPLTRWQRGWKGLRRRPRLALAVSASVLAVAALMGGWRYVTGVQESSAALSANALTAKHERERLEGAAAAGRLAASYAREIAFLGQCWEEGRLTASQLPGAGPEALRGFEWYFLSRLTGREWFVGRGHTKPVTSVAFSPDGQLCASASFDGTSIVWDLATHRPRSRLVGHEGTGAVAFSPDGKTLASGAGAATYRERSELKLWDVATGSERASVLTSLGQGLDRLAFAPDGESLAICGEPPPGDASAKLLWDLRSQRWRALPSNVRDFFMPALAFSRDGKMLAVGCGHGRGGTQPIPDWGAIELFDLAAGTLVATLTGHPALVDSVAFTPDGKTLVSGDLVHTVKVWELAACKARLSLQEFPPAGPWPKIRVLATSESRLTLQVGSHPALSPDGSALAAARDGGVLQLWDVATGRWIARVGTVRHMVKCLSFAPTGTLLAAGLEDGTVHFFEARNIHDLPGHRPAGAWAVAFAPDGKLLATAGDDHTIRLWSVPEFKACGVLRGHTALIASVAFSPDGRTLASGSFDHSVRLWDVATGRATTVLPGHAQDIRVVAFSPDGRRLASAAKSMKKATGELKLWEVPAGNEVAAPPAHGTCFSFSPDGRLLAFRDSNDAVRFLDLATLELTSVLPDLATVNCVAFAPDGRTLATGDTEGAMRLWDVQTGAERERCRAHTDKEVRALVFSPDGKTLASAGMDKTIVLRQAGTGLELLRFKQLPDYAHGLAFSPDSTILAAACDDGTVRVFQGSPSAE